MTSDTVLQILVIVLVLLMSHTICNKNDSEATSAVQLCSHFVAHIYYTCIASECEPAMTVAMVLV